MTIINQRIVTYALITYQGLFGLGYVFFIVKQLEFVKFWNVQFIYERYSTEVIEILYTLYKMYQMKKF